MSTVRLIVDKHHITGEESVGGIVGKREVVRSQSLIASGTIDGRYVEVDLAPLEFKGKRFSLAHLVGSVVVVRYRKLFERKEYHMGEMHIAKLELIDPEILEFIS